jgi:iron-sulfur cluster assembly protein
MNDLSATTPSRPKPRAVITVTPAAIARIRDLLAKATKPVLGIRVGVKATGCSGMSYVVEYAEDRRKFEDVVEVEDVKVFVDPKAVMFLLGSELDYRESKLESAFSFTNPNEKGRCGCGESFSV